MTTRYPIPVHTLVKTLDELLSHLGEAQVADLIRQADASIDFAEHDNWNGGTEYYVMTLRVPVAAFAAIDPRREEIEKLILEKLQLVSRGFGRDVITNVLIVPDAEVTRAPGAGLLSPSILQRIWEGDGLRLFLTHLAEDRIVATALKSQLVPFGVSSFVAHVDIEPNQEWQSEIERALSSMHALAVVLTPGISSSVWCHQEIGFALGSGVPVFPLRLGADPPGFIGTIQALSGSVQNVHDLASNLVDLVIKHPRTASVMREVLLNKFEHVSSWEDARLLNSRIVTITGFDEAQLARLEHTLIANTKVAEAWGVPQAIKQLVRKHRSSPNKMS
jgi:hypothetical protein